MEFSSDDSPSNPDHQPCWDWKEKDWQQYLLVTESQIRDFGVLYETLLSDPHRIEKIAARMGWTSESWPAGEIECNAQKIPYTMHLHPVYILTRGIFRSIYSLALNFAHSWQQHSHPVMIFLSNLHEAETQAILGLESQDMGDMTLTVCHFKKSLAALNDSLSSLSKIAQPGVEETGAFAENIKKRIFDLREVWLKVNNEVREEIHRRETGE